MTFKDFLKNRPEDVKKAKACKTIGEFKKFADDVGISYNGDAELTRAYDFIKNENKELTEEDLTTVAGGGKHSSCYGEGHN